MSNVNKREEWIFDVHVTAVNTLIYHYIKMTESQRAPHAVGQATVKAIHPTAVNVILCARKDRVST